MINPGIAYIDCTKYAAIVLTGPSSGAGTYSGTITDPDFCKKLVNHHDKVVCIKNLKYTNATIVPQIPTGFLDGFYFQAVANSQPVLKASVGGAGVTTRNTARAITVVLNLNNPAAITITVSPTDLAAQA